MEIKKIEQQYYKLKDYEALKRLQFAKCDRLVVDDADDEYEEEEETLIPLAPPHQLVIRIGVHDERMQSDYLNNAFWRFVTEQLEVLEKDLNRSDRI